MGVEHLFQLGLAESADALVHDRAEAVREAISGLLKKSSPVTLKTVKARQAELARRLKRFGETADPDAVWKAMGVRDIAAGLAGLGFKRGDKLSVVGDNRPQLYIAQLSASGSSVSAAEARASRGVIEPSVSMSSTRRSYAVD